MVVGHFYMGAFFLQSRITIHTGKWSRMVADRGELGLMIDECGSWCLALGHGEQ